jgi:uncharacterized protein with PhoU and TrkA domain
LRVPEGSRLVDSRLRDLEADAAKADVALIGVVRDGRRRFGTGRNLKLAAGDILVIEADPPHSMNSARARTWKRPRPRAARER